MTFNYYNYLELLSGIIVGIIFTIIWCGIFTYIALRVTNSIVGLRITDEDEQTGVDLSEHGEKGYN